MDLRWEREKRQVKDERQCQSAKINSESKPMLMFQSALCLFHVFTFFFLHQAFLRLMPAERGKNADKQSSGPFPASIFALNLRKKRKKKKIQPPASPRPSQPLCLSHALTKLSCMGDQTFTVADPELSLAKFLSLHNLQWLSLSLSFKLSISHQPFHRFH